jgi:capsular polysaccharide biosynthesis protein
MSGLAAILELPDLNSYVPVFPPLHPWQLRHLAILGVDAPLQLLDELYFVKDLVFCSSMATFLQHPNTNYRTLHDRQLARALPSNCSFPKIYLARHEQTRRNFLSDPHLREGLAAIGYNVIYPEDYSIDDQVAIFRSAEIIVGCTGAAFANVIFCERNPKVIEIIPLRMVTPRIVGGVWVYNICAMIGCAWRPFFCDRSWADDSQPSISLDLAELNTTFELDLDSFMTYLRETTADYDQAVRA